VRGQRHAPSSLYPRERPGTHCRGDWVGPRAGLDLCGKSRPHRDSIPHRPARSQSLYRLSYPAHPSRKGLRIKVTYIKNINTFYNFQKEMKTPRSYRVSNWIIHINLKSDNSQKYIYIIQSENFSLYCNFRITWYDVVCVASDLGLKGWDSILGTNMGFLFASYWPTNSLVGKEFWKLHRWIMASGDEWSHTLPSHFDVLNMWSHIAYRVCFWAHIFQQQVSRKWIKSDLCFGKETQKMK